MDNPETWAHTVYTRHMRRQNKKQNKTQKTEQINVILETQGAY